MGGGPDHLLILLPQPEPAEIINGLRKKFPNIKITYREVTFHGPGTNDLTDPLPDEIWKDVTILYTLFTLPEKISYASKLQLIQLASAGSNQVQNHPIYTKTDIIITTSSGIHGPQIAEWAVMTALVQSHHYNKLHDLQKEHKWGSKDMSEYRNVKDNVGRTLGVLGYGSIGRQVGRVAQAMGMNVVAYTATPKDTPEKRKDNGFVLPGTGDPDGSIPSAWYSGLDVESRRKFLAQDIDWLLVSVPLTNETRHFLSMPEFKILGREGNKPAFITNIARGPIIDQPKLIAALKDGLLSGAALDVSDPEPLPADNELWDLPNVIITPHISGSSQAYSERSFQVLEENLKRRENGLKLLNVVRRSRGY
ncbi:hypothetical protein M433DRAFT_66173 [Acidomyces richmondensis BFW]|nr:MAG: hypothetical protein FE78DRAFT_70442 [Acidomyces sp. 'richmondensis']KYG45947.1 hypothetical protein M433DRAFT_66173 [Acidomyces richmondensis BFW]